MKEIYNNKWLKLVILIIIFQQLLVATGTYLLGKLSGDYPTHGFQLGLAGILFICIILPGTLVHYAVSWFTVKCCKASQLNYLEKYAQINFNKPTIWRDEKSKQQRHDMMCRSGQDAIFSWIHFIIDFVATSLNIIFNTISIILVTDLLLGLTIVFAGLLGLGIIHLSEKRITKTSRNEIEAENILNGHLSRSWDNIVLGNQFFYNRWNLKFSELFYSTEKASLDVVKSQDKAISIAGFITNGLVLGMALFLAWYYQSIAGFVLAILVMLPRSLQIVMHIQIIQSYFARWKNIHERLNVAEESILNPKFIDLDPLIKKTEISVMQNNNEISVSDLEFLQEKNQVGRYTIRGQNGAGKSSLLLQLKDKFGVSAIYLPAHHQLMLKDAQVNLSTGEIALAALKDLEIIEENRVLLLDEWDANLSFENRVVLDKMIDVLSLKRLVIESRHSVTSRP